MNVALSKILPVLPTPFLASGEIDLPAMSRIVKYAIEVGVNGVVFPGFASEVEYLTDSERKDLLAVVVKSCAGALLVIAGVSANTVEEVVRHGQVAKDMDIDWLMIQPPKLLGSNAANIIKFFDAVSSALPSAKIILQNAPSPRGADLSPLTILEIVRAVPQIAYVKEETLPAGPAISLILAQKPDSLLGVIGGGGARYILDEYKRGACAAMPAIEIAEAHVSLDQAWRSGDKAKARNIYINTLPLLTLQAVYRMRLTKHVMMRRGILKNDYVRAPTVKLDNVSKADIDENLVELGIISAGNIVVPSI